MHRKISAVNCVLFPAFVEVHLSEKVFEEPLNVYFNKDTVMEDHETGGV
jgi:hypothetical protein